MCALLPFSLCRLCARVTHNRSVGGGGAQPPGKGGGTEGLCQPRCSASLWSVRGALCTVAVEVRTTTGPKIDAARPADLLGLSELATRTAPASTTTTPRLARVLSAQVCCVIDPAARHIGRLVSGDVIERAKTIV